MRWQDRRAAAACVLRDPEFIEDECRMWVSVSILRLVIFSFPRDRGIGKLLLHDHSTSKIAPPPVAVWDFAAFGIALPNQYPRSYRSVQSTRGSLPMRPLIMIKPHTEP